MHHAVPGLFLLLAGAVTATGATEPLFRCVAGAAVGAGASLVLDEFALILHLSDVYWSEQGRASVQAVALVAARLLLALLGFAPVSADDFSRHPQTFLPPLAIWVTLIAASVVCVRKGKYRWCCCDIPADPGFHRGDPAGPARISVVQPALPAGLGETRSGHSPGGPHRRPVEPAVALAGRPDRRST